VLVVINHLNSNPVGPVFQFQLLTDTGKSTNDLITRDPTIDGKATSSDSTVVSAKVRFNRDRVFSLLIDASRHFSFDPRTAGNLDQGTINVSVAVELASGGVSIRKLSFVYDSIAPGLSGPKLAAADDTGASNSDGMTRIVEPRLQIQTDIGAELNVLVSGQQFSETMTNPLWERKLATLADGIYPVTATVTDIAGNVKTSEAMSIQIDVTPPFAPALDLDPDSDSAPIGDKTTSFGTVTFVGQTTPAAMVKLVQTGETVAADSNGVFRFSNQSLAFGTTAFATQAVDLAGNQASSTSSFNRGLPIELSLDEATDRISRVTLPISIITQPGTMTIEFDLATSFDKNATDSNLADTFSVYLQDAKGFTLVDRGVYGTALYSLDEDGESTATSAVNVTAGNGHIAIDISRFQGTQATLVFELFNADSDQGSTVQITNLAILRDPNGTINHKFRRSWPSPSRPPSRNNNSFPMQTFMNQSSRKK